MSEAEKQNSSKVRPGRVSITMVINKKKWKSKDVFQDLVRYVTMLKLSFFLFFLLMIDLIDRLVQFSKAIYIYRYVPIQKNKKKNI